MTYGHAEIARRAAGLHDKETECVRCAFAVAVERIPDAPIEVQLGSVIGKAADHAATNGATQEQIRAALELELAIYERSC